MKFKHFRTAFPAPQKTQFHIHIHIYVLLFLHSASILNAKYHGHLSQFNTHTSVNPLKIQQQHKSQGALFVCVKEMLWAMPNPPTSTPWRHNCSNRQLGWRRSSSSTPVGFVTSLEDLLVHLLIPRPPCQILTTAKPKESETGPDPEEDLVDYFWHTS